MSRLDSDADKGLCCCFCVQQEAEELPEDGELELNDLGQLPGHHPLIKDGMSDEGLSQQHFSLSAVFPGAHCKMFYSSEARPKSSICSLNQ